MLNMIVNVNVSGRQLEINKCHAICILMFSKYSLRNIVVVSNVYYDGDVDNINKGNVDNLKIVDNLKQYLIFFEAITKAKISNMTLIDDSWSTKTLICSIFVTFNYQVPVGAGLMLTSTTVRS